MSPIWLNEYSTAVPYWLTQPCVGEFHCLSGQTYISLIVGMMLIYHNLVVIRLTSSMLHGYSATVLNWCMEVFHHSCGHYNTLPLSWAGTVLLWSSMWTLSGCSSQHEYALYCSHPLFVGHPTYVPHWFMDIEPMLQSAWGHYNCTSLFEWAFHWCSPPSVYIVLLLLPYWGSTPLMCLTIWAWQFWFLHYLVALCWSPPLLNGPILLHPTTQMGIMLAIWLL